MSKHSTLLQHFRSFAFQNTIKEFDKALEYFSVFGGTGWDVDVSKSLEALIEEKVLRNYEPIHTSMIRYTHNNPVYHQFLSLIALGTEYEHDVFKKAKVGKDRGEEGIDYLEQKSLLRFDLSVEKPLHESDTKSDRLLFTLPFMRFWFAMVSPHYKSISEGNFVECIQKWMKVRENFSILLSNLLIRELVLKQLATKFVDDPIVSIGCYYEKQIFIEILAKRKSGKMVAGGCKYSKDAAKTNMLVTLKQKCKTAELNVDAYVLFSKNGFTPELEQNIDTKTTLLKQTQLNLLLDNLSKDDLLGYTNKKY